jgi:hypothetical protein
MTLDINTSIWLVIKVFFIVTMVLYTGFSLIMVRQEQLMSDVLEEGFESVLRLLTIIHLIAAAAMIFIAIILL